VCSMYITIQELNLGRSVCTVMNGWVIGCLGEPFEVLSFRFAYMYDVPDCFG
jgi:hypothetical protein